VIWALLVGCAAQGAEPDQGQVLAASAGCALCHVVPGVAQPDRTESCAGCHAWIHQVAVNPPARQAAMTVFPLWERYERNVRTYAEVPDLSVAFARLDPAWLRTYLRDPYDLRPNLPETMVRLGLKDADVEAIVRWATKDQVPVARTPRPSKKNVAAGESVFQARGCSACHTFGTKATMSSYALAPDLRHARDRMTDDRIVAWIEDPPAMAPHARMPKLGLTHEEAIQVRDFLVLTDPGSRPAPAPAAAAAPPAEVRWADVEARVFGKICTHCHMEPSLNEGRAGPGNGGGFGWPATGIQLQTAAGAREHQDAVLAAVKRRRDEMARDRVGVGEAPIAITRPEKPGMPLGLPALSEEDIALLEAWYAAGAPD
jgi:cytochrome c2